MNFAVSTMNSALEMMNFVGRPGTAAVQGLPEVVCNPHFDRGMAAWYFVPEDSSGMPVWAHERKGTVAHSARYPDWSRKPSRALHGWLVYICKDQAALVIQRIGRGWLTRLAAPRAKQEFKYFKKLDEVEYKAAQMIQARHRGAAARRKKLMETRSAVHIQSIMRGNLVRRKKERACMFDELSQAPRSQARKDARDSNQPLMEEIVGNLWRRFCDWNPTGEEGFTVTETIVRQIITDSNLDPQVLERSHRLVGSDLDAGGAYGFDDICALIAAAAGPQTQKSVAAEAPEGCIKAMMMMKTSCVMTSAERDSQLNGAGQPAGRHDIYQSLADAELHKLLRMLHKPAELRTDKELESLDKRWASGYEWFQDIKPELRRETCRYLRGGVLVATELIYQVGEPLTAVFFVARGSVRLQPGGLNVEASAPATLVGPGETFGFPSEDQIDADRSVDSAASVGGDSGGSAPRVVMWDERRTEVAEAEEGTVLLTLGIEMWSWVRAERTARERSTLCRLLRRYFCDSKNDESCIKHDEFCIKMMDFAFKLITFVLKMMNFYEARPCSTISRRMIISPWRPRSRNLQ